jgi:hypothetical protein
VELENLEVPEARKTLGVKTAPIGDNDAQFEHMLEASQKWAAHINAINLRQMDAWLALRSTIWKTLDYTLTCTTLTEKQCEQIMRPAISAGMAKYHICRSFPTSLLHAGSAALGACLPHLFTVQGIAHLSTLVSHSPGGSITSLLLRAAMEAALQEAGCGPYPWHPEVKVVLQAITKTWISSVMTFMEDNGINPHHNIRMAVYSQKDSFLMENFTQQGALSPELISMIQCRNFLRVSRMSELTSEYGSRILLRMYNGDVPESDATNQWPIQPRPPKWAWMIWKKYLSFMVTSQTTLILRQPLGKCKAESPRTPWKYHEPSDRIYF